MATAPETLKDILNRANPNTLADAIKQIALGTMLKAMEEKTITQAAAAAMTLDPPAAIVSSLQVTAVGTGALGARIVGGSAATPSATVARLSADGKTLTFEGTVTSATVRYLAAPAVDVDAIFERT